MKLEKTEQGSLEHSSLTISLDSSGSELLTSHQLNPQVFNFSLGKGTGLAITKAWVYSGWTISVWLIVLEDPTIKVPWCFTQSFHTVLCILTRFPGHLEEKHFHNVTDHPAYPHHSGDYSLYNHPYFYIKPTLSVCCLWALLSFKSIYFFI